MLNKYSFIDCNAKFEDSKKVIIGAPFDGTVSYRPGTRFAPSAIRLDSQEIETYSPYQDDDLTNHQICDLGDLCLPIGNTDAVLTMIENEMTNIFASKKKPVLIGGEHLITLPSYRAALKLYPDLKLIQLDAHTDLRDDYLGVKLSHATVIRRCHNMVGDNNIFQFGIRSGTKEEFEFAKEHTSLHKFDLSQIPNTVRNLQNEKVYLTIDLDVLDTSVLPGTGTPEPGGISFAEILNSFDYLKELDIVGADICELAPTLDPSGVSTAVACKILRELLLII